jgi:hypothetical protein
MEHQITAKSRKELKNKMAAVFSQNIKGLSVDLQGVLLDDMVTALESRLAVLERIDENAQFAAAIPEDVDCETVQT